MEQVAATPRYHPSLVIIHWLMAACFVLMLTSGLLMVNVELEKSLTFKLYQWHKSLGGMLLWLIGIRLLLRFTTRIPALPAVITGRHLQLAKLGHLALYLAMIGLPLSGWLIVSSSSSGLPTLVFGWFEWPHIPNLAGNKLWHEIGETAHGLIAYAFIGLLVAHIGAVIYHKRRDKIALLPRMGFGKRAKEQEPV